jgi:hypothetical protein
MFPVLFSLPPAWRPRCGLEDRRIVLDHLRALGRRSFGLAFLLLLVVVLRAGELIAERASAIEGAFFLVQTLDTFGERRSAFRLGHT